jgi:hypothetical protein
VLEREREMDFVPSFVTYDVSKLVCMSNAFYHTGRQCCIVQGIETVYKFKYCSVANLKEWISVREGH